MKIQLKLKKIYNNLCIISSKYSIAITIYYLVVIIFYVIYKLHMEIIPDNIVQDVEKNDLDENTIKETLKIDVKPEKLVVEEEQGYVSYFSFSNGEMELPIPYGKNEISIRNTIPYKSSNDSRYQQSILSEVEKDQIEKVIVDKGPIINKDLPFEAPIIITVKEDPLDVVIFEIQHDLLEDQLNSILAPSYEGIETYSSETIFQMHLDIVKIIKTKLDSQDIISDKEAQQIIKNMVIQYMTDYNIYSSITVSNLKNTNYIINLLLKEMIINSLIVYDFEKFIFENVISTLILESLSHLQNNSTDYYNDDSLSYATIRNTVSRFI